MSQEDRPFFTHRMGPKVGVIPEEQKAEGKTFEPDPKIVRQIREAALSSSIGSHGFGRHSANAITAAIGREGASEKGAGELGSEDKK